MNGSSKEERDAWMEAIRRAVPSSPRVNRKPLETKPKESPNSGSKEAVPSHPSYTSRQDTACDAAIAVASHTNKQQEQKAVEEVSRGCGFGCGQLK